ncbi:MAG: DUF87 domain-containing protein [Anaerolineae bacterium]|nr:DUF87 domain-containing protein [Anaerolineae bacterium]
MTFIEAPTTFYLGRRYDPAAGKLTGEAVYYDSRDLTTHAVVLGMTGSGKTGLCITLLEEAILDNLPALIMDPKGDITNLLLNFPDMRPQDFEPWVNVDDARRTGMDVPQYAAKLAADWRDGLADWGIVPDRLRWLQMAAQFSVYTPGSDAGLPISILASFRAPQEDWEADAEANRERVNGTVTALLALVGQDGAAMHDREHVLLANIFEANWRAGQDLTLETLVQQVRRPPFEKLGVFAVDEYIPAREREKLARALNGMIAAPGFQSWTNGDPLDIPSLLYTPDGRPRVSIFYTAHLNEAERQFITTLLLEGMAGWMRTLSGTTSLRALLYIDELYGYFPPHPRNPPTKEPLLRLLKQARAFGIGLVLATQNPGDLDYKGLTNCGTWFIGRLQAETDREKVTEGLQLMDNTAGAQDVDALIARIPPRTFLMHNIHNPAGPLLFGTRWAMSLLRGPLTRQQIAVLMKAQRLEKTAAMRAATSGMANPTYANAVSQAIAEAIPLPQPKPRRPVPPPALPETPTEPAPTVPAVPAQAVPAPTRRAQPIPGFNDSPPALPAGVAQYHLMPAFTAAQAAGQWQGQVGAFTAGGPPPALVYQPGLLAQATVRYQDRKSGVYTARSYTVLVPGVERTGYVGWPDHAINPIDPRTASAQAQIAGYYGDLSDGLTDGKRLTALRREYVDHLFATARLMIPGSAALGLYGTPDTDPATFRNQAAQAARERRDAEMDALTRKYEGVIDSIEDKMRRKARQLESEKRELRSTSREKTFTTGEAMLGLLRGRSAFTLSRMSRSEVYRQRSLGQVELYEYDLQALNDEMEEAKQRFEAELAALNQKWAQAATQIETQVVAPYKKDITLDLFGVGWQPCWVVTAGGQAVLLPAR